MKVKDSWMGVKTREEIKASILIPVYNQEVYLCACLNSLVSQDCNDIEVIIIDDGSNDNSAQICQEYVIKYDYFHYIYQENMGLGEARNTGLRYAQGTYIFFLDADDVIQENCIGKLLLFAKRNNADIVYFDEIVCDENLTVLSVRRTYSEMDIKISKLKALELSMNPAHVCARLYRKSLFQNISFAKIWYEDIEIFPRLLIKAEELYYYKIPIYYYRQHEKGITSRKNDVRNLDVIKAWNSVYINAIFMIKEKNAIEKCIKSSIYTFIFYRPKYAPYYVNYYNVFWGCRSNKRQRQITCLDIKNTPLWQQADFYKQIYILKVLTGLQNIYQYGGILQFADVKKVNFLKTKVAYEKILIFCGEDIAIRQMEMQRGNKAVFDVLKELLEWNLISLKNQIKDFTITKIIMEKMILNDVKIEVEKSYLDWRIININEQTEL